ncbi:uncharacterized protein F5147DRAFT_819133 [Suillus discolor]|uniref:CHAT domain-containing protein n=1 Tax=Suillus discolor TaxID=1912936 RepID=A0A9P7JPE9_9AGAM|nr:uncharacterized protein F5147DRAFT_819133 [Suillus discolor]KAG2095436.1 hypothetical protein F5147DRAFT_819133 [Suillus discolor]
MSDLDEAIELHRAALLFPSGHSDRSSCLNNLANSLRNRFQQCGMMSDLDEAIELHQAALLLRPPRLSLWDRFLQRDMMSDLDEAIELHRAALLFPSGHSDRSSCLNNLANSLRNRFQQCGMMSDLDEAIELHQAALLLHPPGHSLRSSSLNNLGLSLRDRFQQWGVMSDLDEAIKLHQAALLLCPPGHSDRSSSLHNLPLSLQDRFRKWDVQCDLDEAFSLYSQLSHLSHAASRTHLSAAKSWAASAEIFNHPSALLAYKVALKFLDQQVAFLSSSSHHFDVIREAVSSLATDAFSCSVRCGSLTTAVELVEQGRAVFWTQLARFSTPLDELSDSGDAGMVLAEEFKHLKTNLRKSDKLLQWDDVVSRVRMLPDFSCFLLPPLFSDLQKVAEDGPVIIVNASQHSCNTLIIHGAGDPVHVPLDIKQAEVSEFSSEFQSLAEQFGSSDYQLVLVGILHKLWNDVVDPVVRALRESEVRPGSPGPYEKGRDNLSDIYISSYTPTLATLVHARQQVSRDASSQHFVAIGQGNPVEGKELKCVAPELAVVARHITPVISFTSLEDANATVEGAFDALNHNQWLHLACHGMPNRTQPFESSFAMRDGPLMIKDII